MADEQYAFRAHIARTLAEHPEWLPDALSAVSAGMAEAIKKIEQRAGGYMNAMWCAMALAGEKRLSAEAKETFNGLVNRVIREHGGPCNEVERDWLDAAAGRAALNAAKKDTP